jgi:hypothetical protein
MVVHLLFDDRPFRLSEAAPSVRSRSSERHEHGRAGTTRTPREEPPMSIAEITAVSVPSGTTWRPLGPALWVGRTEAGPAGTIERGRRYVVTDAEGRRRGAYRSLDAAMTALDARRAADEPTAGASWEPLVLVTTLAGAASALLAVYALVGI